MERNRPGDRGVRLMLRGMHVDAVEARILGSLIEKQLTTPQQYPLTLNALVLACNQSSNREPVTSHSESEVEVALSSLKEKGLVRFVLPSHGRSVVRYRQVLDERLALDGRQMALIAVLVLRGPQTIGELRARTERMATFDGVSSVEADLEGLTRGEDPYVVRLERRPGQKEERWAQLLCDEIPPEAFSFASVGGGSAFATGSATGGGSGGGWRAELDSLRGHVESLQVEMGSLQAEVASLRELILGL